MKSYKEQEMIHSTVLLENFYFSFPKLIHSSRIMWMLPIFIGT
ncbi:MAG: hypothetical protein V3S73_01220 [Gammaproteobacteria bacterium]